MYINFCGDFCRFKRKLYGATKSTLTYSTCSFSRALRTIQEETTQPQASQLRFSHVMILTRFRRDCQNCSWKGLHVIDNCMFLSANRRFLTVVLAGGTEQKEAVVDGHDSTSRRTCGNVQVRKGYRRSYKR